MGYGIERQVASSQNELDGYYRSIARLFKSAFGKDLSRTLWEQYYLENPYGPSKVVMLFKDQELVGHYGLVPQILAAGDGHTVPYYLAITLMIAPEYQNTQVFVLLVRELLETARKSDRHFLLAFLNQRSFLPLSKLFDWQCLVETPFYRLALHETDYRTRTITSLERLETDTGLSHPYDKTFWQWRSRRNTYQACQVGGSLQVLYKALDERTMDVMDLSVIDAEQAPQDLYRLAAQTGFAQVVLTGYHAERLGLETGALERWGDYVVRMCGYPLSQAEVPDVRFSLMLSDVF